MRNIQNYYVSYSSPLKTLISKKKNCGNELSTRPVLRPLNNVPKLIEFSAYNQYSVDGFCEILPGNSTSCIVDQLLHLKFSTLASNVNGYKFPKFTNLELEIRMPAGSRITYNELFSLVDKT